MNDYKSVATNSQEEEKFRYNHMLYKLQEKTGMNHAYMRFETKTKYENLNLVIVISPFSKNKEHDIIVTDHTTYIMTDDGKTIEKIFQELNNKVWQPYYIKYETMKERTNMDKIQVFKINEDQFDLSNLPNIKSILIIIDSKLEGNIVDSFYIKVQSIAYALVWKNSSLSVFMAEDYKGQYTEDYIAEMLIDEGWID